MSAESQLSNADRLKAQQYIAELESSGQLTDVDVRRLNAAVWQVSSRHELDGLLNGATSGTEAQLADHQPDPYLLVPMQNRAPVQDSFGDSSSTQIERALRPDEHPIPASIGFWGVTERIGRWAVGRKHVSVAVMGGTTLDLRDAAFEGHDIEVTCVSFWGGTDIIVPPEMQVRINGIGIMGEFGWHKKKFATSQQPFDPELPILTLNGVALMGAVEIHRLEYGEEFIDD